MLFTQDPEDSNAIRAQTSPKNIPHEQHTDSMTPEKVQKEKQKQKEMKKKEREDLKKQKDQKKQKRDRKDWNTATKQSCKRKLKLDNSEPDDIKPIDSGDSVMDMEFEVENPGKDDAVCLFCESLFSEDIRGELWVQCLVCEMWAHSECAGCKKTSPYNQLSKDST
ncbi:hypothetical protein FQR65_LT13437 [Abscondita terminalis]|nr:hypothetical protein FQR65_LT13437 [Abscondita terminalis]